MEVAFDSALGLSATLERVGFEMGVAQLSRGTLQGIVRLGGSKQLPVLSIQTNQDLVVYGNRRPGVLPFTLNISDHSSGHSLRTNHGYLDAVISVGNRQCFCKTNGRMFGRRI